MYSIKKYVLLVVIISLIFPSAFADVATKEVRSQDGYFSLYVPVSITVVQETVTAIPSGGKLVYLNRDNYTFFIDGNNGTFYLIQYSPKTSEDKGLIQTIIDFIEGIL